MKKNKDKTTASIQGNITRVKIANSMLKFSSLYRTKKLSLQIIIIFILALLSAVLGVLLIENTGLYDIGLASISQGLGRIAYYEIYNNTSNSELSYAIFNLIFWGVYLLFNIPLAIFGWFKIGKKFTVLSIIYIVISTLGGLGIAFIPGIEEVFVLGNLTLDHAPFLNTHNVQIVLWNYAPDAAKHFTIFLYGVLWGLFQAVVYAVLLIIDCSTGGLDFLAVWYGETRYKDIGSGLTIVNIMALIMGYIIGSYVPVSLALQQIPDTVNITNGPTSYYQQLNTLPWEVDLFFSPNFLSSFLMNLLLGLFLNFLFPKYQMVRAEIFSSKAESICDHLINEKKPYSLSLNQVIGGYSKKPNMVLITNCMFLEVAELLEVVRQYDPNALFVISLLKKVDGYINMSTKKDDEQFSKIFKKNVSKKSKHNQDHHKNEKQIDLSQPLSPPLVIDKSLVKSEITEPKKAN